jgi:hypothetical protein
MGLVKFGQTTLNVAEIPDGHIVISDAQFQAMKGAENNYLALKASIPYGVDMSQLSTIVEKGSRFDAISTELNTVKQQLGATTQKLQGFSNLPADFSLDEYKALKNEHAIYERGAALEDLFAKTAKYVEETHRVKMPTVDLRFVDEEALNAIDPKAVDAPAKMAIIFDKAHSAQQEFVAKMGGTPSQPATQVQQGAPLAPANPRQYFPPTKIRDMRPQGDSVLETGYNIERV